MNELDLELHEGDMWDHTNHRMIRAKANELRIRTPNGGTYWLTCSPDGSLSVGVHDPLTCDLRTMDDNGRAVFDLRLKEGAK